MVIEVAELDKMSAFALICTTQLTQSNMTILVYGVIAALIYTLYGAYWRLFLSPVSKFPGPRLAGVTFWYEFYYDVIKGGAYVYEIERMHQRYGECKAVAPRNTGG